MHEIFGRGKNYDPDINIEDYENIDSSLNLRCNKKLREDFNKLCKKNQTTASSAVKQYMLVSVVKNKIT